MYTIAAPSIHITFCIHLNSIWGSSIYVGEDASILESVRLRVDIESITTQTKQSVGLSLSGV